MIDITIKILSLLVTILGIIVSAFGIYGFFHDYRNKLLTKEDFFLTTFIFLAGLAMVLVSSRVLLS